MYFLLCVLSSEEGRVDQFTRLASVARLFPTLYFFLQEISEEKTSDVCHPALFCDRHCSLILIAMQKHEGSSLSRITRQIELFRVINQGFSAGAGEAGTITASEEEKLRNDCRTALSCPPGKPNTTHYKIGRNRTNCPLRDLPKQM